jgi:hypothetical protein
LIAQFTGKKKEFVGSTEEENFGTSERENENSKLLELFSASLVGNL